MSQFLSHKTFATQGFYQFIRVIKSHYRFYPISQIQVAKPKISHFKGRLFFSVRKCAKKLHKLDVGLFFTTMTGKLLKLSDWLVALECTHVAMESTGVVSCG